ncbi:MAG: hypothetical protein A2Y79_03845 [Deltaproteobacteria bacterium RBG_13_43_22]|nr:MAG: hypothetical protein A2Y79_03845 [Deltaproteobacteria bacterium RBG_13_43_22]
MGEPNLFSIANGYKEVKYPKIIHPLGEATNQAAEKFPTPVSAISLKSIADSDRISKGTSIIIPCGKPIME